MGNNNIWAVILYILGISPTEFSGASVWVDCYRSALLVPKMTRELNMGGHYLNISTKKKKKDQRVVSISF